MPTRILESLRRLRRALKGGLRDDYRAGRGRDGKRNGRRSDSAQDQGFHFLAPVRDTRSKRSGNVEVPPQNFTVLFSPMSGGFLVRRALA